MQKTTRLLESLLENLENVDIKLNEVNIGTNGIDIFTQNNHQSCSQMKNVLNTLVRKITFNKSDEDDISLNGEVPFPNEELLFQNVISSDEYLEETKRILTAFVKPNVPTLVNFIFKFLELLGDILYSICQINMQMITISFGILVQDLVKLNNYYISIWDKISKTCSNKSININLEVKHIDLQQRSVNEPIQIKLVELQKAVQHCLKEMYKVKLEIEHYFKVNMIEIQFTVPCDKVTNSDISEFTGLYKETTFETPEDIKKRFDIMSNVNTSSKRIPDLESNILNHSLADTENKILKFSNGKSVNNESYSDLFCNTFIHNHEYNQANLSPLQMYSGNCNDETDKNKVKINKDSDENEEANFNHNGLIKTDIGQLKNKDILRQTSPVKNILQEDLFSDINIDLDDSQYMKLNENMSSLSIGILKSNSKELLFNERPLKNENINLNCLTENSKLIHSQNSILPDPMNQYSNSIIFENINTKKVQPQSSEQMENFSMKPTENNDNSEQYFFTPFSYKGIQVNTLDKLQPPSRVESMVELYINNKISHGSQDCSPPGCIWPVEAKYIYTSKVVRQRSYISQTCLNNNFTSPLNTFGKYIFYTHLNKTLEQNKNDGEEFNVLKTSQAFNNDANSLFNPPYAYFNDGQAEVKANIYEGNFGSHSNSPIFEKDIIPTAFDIKKQSTLKLIDYQEPLLEIKRNFERENFDFLKINGYNVNNNWNAFMSMFTSKVEPATAKINHHSIENEHVTGDNMFDNVNNLKSNEGPFWLFDINGYPLTNSTGNVLKDPYGKAVMILDSNGFPKDDIKVFDAAGNPKQDINFNPTQKPKTNTIIVKLTDNSKRPLHLFDKYGRPLTDSLGNLLVNIHGRPLLRFDDLGRPDTDYRGGPLYTDNGCKWSYKTDESSSTESLHNKIILEEIKTDNLRDELVEVDKTCEGENMMLSTSTGLYDVIDTYRQNAIQTNKVLQVHSTCSDIWIKVESILKCLPNKSKPKASQTDIIINNVTVLHEPIEEFLKPIIYHENIIQQNTNKLENNSLINEINNYYTRYICDNVQDKESKCNKTLMNHNLNCLSKEKICFENNSIKKTYFLPYYNNIKLQKTYSKSLHTSISTTFQDHKCKCNFINKYYYAQDENNQRTESIFNFNDVKIRNGLVPSTFWNPIAETMNEKSSKLKKNTDHLIKLCNKMLTDQINSKDKSDQNIETDETYKERNVKEIIYTETESSECTSVLEQEPVSENTCKDSKSGYFKYKNPVKNEILVQTNKQKGYDESTNFKHYLKNNKTALELSEMITESSGQLIQESVKETNNDNILSNILNLGKTCNKIMVANQVEQGSACTLAYNVSTASNTEKELRPEIKHKILQMQAKKSCQFIRQNGAKEPILWFPPESQLKESVPESEVKNENIEMNLIYFRDYSECISKDDTISKHHIIGSVQSRDCIRKRSMEKPQVNEYGLLASNPRIQKITQKTNQETNSKSNKRKDIHVIKSPGKTECRFISFLGNPVKYILNKLENKCSSRPQLNTAGKVGMLTKLHLAKNNNEAFAYSKAINDITNKPKLKTLYTCHRSRNKQIGDNNLKQKSIWKQTSELIAFRTKSCDDILSKHCLRSISYSGKGKKESHISKNKKINNFIPCKYDLRKFLSVNSFLNECKAKYNSSRHRQNVEQRRPTQKYIEAFKPTRVRTKYTVFHPNTNQKDVDNNKNGKHPKSIRLSRN